jgi:hypothetical protein
MGTPNLWALFSEFVEKEAWMTFVYSQKAVVVWGCSDMAIGSSKTDVEK